MTSRYPINAPPTKRTIARTDAPAVTYPFGSPQGKENKTRNYQHDARRGQRQADPERSGAPRWKNRRRFPATAEIPRPVCRTRITAPCKLRRICGARARPPPYPAPAGCGSPGWRGVNLRDVPEGLEFVQKRGALRKPARQRWRTAATCLVAGGRSGSTELISAVKPAGPRRILFSRLRAFQHFTHLLGVQLPDPGFRHAHGSRRKRVCSRRRFRAVSWRNNSDSLLAQPDPIANPSCGSVCNADGFPKPQGRAYIRKTNEGKRRNR